MLSLSASLTVSEPHGVKSAKYNSNRRGTWCTNSKYLQLTAEAVYLLLVISKYRQTKSISEVKTPDVQTCTKGTYVLQQEKPSSSSTLNMTEQRKRKCATWWCKQPPDCSSPDLKIQRFLL